LKAYKSFLQLSVLALLVGCGDSTSPSPRSPAPDEVYWNQTISYGTLIDSRDGKTYRTIMLGPDTWMAQNLDYLPDSGNSKCFNSEAINCQVYGRLYDWETANLACPSGWHLPTESDWLDIEIQAVKVSLNVGQALKTTTGWYDKNNGQDIFGFSALPGASSSAPLEDVDGLGQLGGFGEWWTATEDTNYTGENFSRPNALENYLNWNSSRISIRTNNKRNGNSVRCVKDLI
jgi:uncharacterized protein (TIGR02145 family)